jgi:3-isopropylmalate dehydrogenase
MERKSLKITLLDGDGIGPEVNAQAVKALSAVADIFRIRIEFGRGPIGGASIRDDGSPLTDETVSRCLSSDAVLLGAVGSPEFDHLDPSERPESGLLRLRKELGGFANLRPAFAVPELLGASPLRKEIAEKTDMLIVRELLGGLYFGEPRGIAEDRRSAFNTMTYSVGEIERVARVAFGIARKRRGKLTSVDKANVLETSRLWRNTVDAVGQEFPDVRLDHLFVDACAMHLVTEPARFDVILTENLFGDILSDEASILCGSLGMLASATLGGSVDLYEPVHGSAPDIAGTDMANPLGAIESAAMLLEHTAGHPKAAAAVRSAVRKVLREGHRTADIAGSEALPPVSTSQMGDLVAAEIKGLAIGGSAHAA